MEHSAGRKIAFYGHSLGGAIAFACAVRLDEQFGVYCTLLAMGGISCPSRSRTNEILQVFYDTSGMESVPAIDDVGEAAYLGWMEQSMGSVLPPVDLRQAYVRTFGRILNADLRLAESFFSQDWERHRLNCLVQIFCASHDSSVPLSSMAEWERKASKSFELIQVPSDEHLFIMKKDHRQLVCKAMSMQ